MFTLDRTLRDKFVATNTVKDYCPCGCRQVIDKPVRQQLRHILMRQTMFDLAMETKLEARSSRYFQHGERYWRTQRSCREEVIHRVGDGIKENDRNGVEFPLPSWIEDEPYPPIYKEIVNSNHKNTKTRPGYSVIHMYLPGETSKTNDLYVELAGRIVDPFLVLLNRDEYVKWREHVAIDAYVKMDPTSDMKYTFLPNWIFHNPNTISFVIGLLRVATHMTSANMADKIRSMVPDEALESIKKGDIKTAQQVAGEMVKFFGTIYASDIGPFSYENGHKAYYWTQNPQCKKLYYEPDLEEWATLTGIHNVTQFGGIHERFEEVIINDRLASA